jgi:GAF domain-containing protein
LPPDERLSPAVATEQNGQVAHTHSRIRPHGVRDVEQGRAAETEAERLGSELSALRRIALLVARAAPEAELLEAIAEEIAQLLGTEDVRIFRYEEDRDAVVVAARGDEDELPLGSHHRLGGANATSAVFRTRQPARIDDLAEKAGGAIGETARRVGIRSVVAAPIMVAGRLWGAITVGSRIVDRLPAETEARLGQFTELTASAIANAESRGRGDRLADEQAALRRVATLVAQNVPANELCMAVLHEAGSLLGADFAGMLRLDDARTATTVATWGATGEHPPSPERWLIEPGDPMAMIMGTGEPARVEDWAAVPGRLAEYIREELDVCSSVGCSIVVEGAVWGGLAVHSKQGVLAADTESRLRSFADLVATALANRDSRVQVTRLAQEQAALRRVATLVARGTGPESVFRAVADEAGALMGCDTAAIVRFEADGWATVMGTHQARRAPGDRFQPDPDYIVESVQRTGHAARFDTDDSAADGMPDAVRAEGIRSALATPIVVDGDLWGTITVASLHGPLPVSTERRLADFTELVATAISNSEGKAEVARLAEEQAALRRVATLVAEGVPPDALFSAVCHEVEALAGAVASAVVRFEPDNTVTIMGTHAGSHTVGARVELTSDSIVAEVHRTGRAARFDTDDPAAPGTPDVARAERLRSWLASPIVIEGELWGAITTGAHERRLPAGIERRLADFTELIATAISKTQAREELRQLADTQGALRRVATLVAREASQAEVFTAIAEECAALFGVEETRMMRFDASGSELVVVAGSGGPTNLFPVGSHHPLRGENAAARVFRTGRPARVDDFAMTALGPIGAVSRSAGIRSAVSTPITVAGRVWGALSMGTYGDPLPAYTESRVAEFTELMATAIANTESRATADRLADEQAALRRVATLVAQEAPLEAVFAKVADEVARTLGNVDSALWRDDGDGTATAVAVRGPGGTPGVNIGTRLSLEGDSVIARVLREGRPHQIDDYSRLAGSIAERARELGMRSAVGCPIVVGSRTWGAMTVATYEAEPFARETETRVARFSDLVATAIANAEARAEVERLAAEQAALRRVATLVAEGAEPAGVFDAVAAEMEALLGADQVSLGRYEPGTEVTVVAHRGTGAWRLPPGSRLGLQGESVTTTVRRTKRPARIEDFERADGPIAAIVRAMGMRVSVGAPIIVDGRLWGVITARWAGKESPPGDTEERMTRFAELLDSAIANADSRNQLTASRARLVAAGDDARRRVVRDLHDGAQQGLVHTIVALKLAKRALRQQDGRAESRLAEALAHAEKSNEDLRELAHGILPAVLTRGGLPAGVRALTSRLQLPVELDLASERVQADVEASAYFMVAEALTNVVKHAHASQASVRTSVADGALRVEVTDDGIGGADPTGHGLIGMVDRVTALGGRLEIATPPTCGTRVTATFPLSIEA